MGDPYFKIRDLCRVRGVRVFSSNYTLYGDMSGRTNAVYRQFSPQVEIYSIDESFLNLSDVAPGLRVELARDLRATVRAWTGIPTCVGIGPTKTLAKLANHVAKTVPGARRRVRPDRSRGLRTLAVPGRGRGGLGHRPRIARQAGGDGRRERGGPARPRPASGAQGADGGGRAHHPRAARARLPAAGDGAGPAQGMRRDPLVLQPHRPSGRCSRRR